MREILLIGKRNISDNLGKFEIIKHALKYDKFLKLKIEREKKKEER